MTTTEQHTHADERGTAIAGIRAIADWLEANPDVPAPHHVELAYFDQNRRDESVAEASRIAETHAGTKHNVGDGRWVHVKLPVGGVKGMYTFYVTATPAQSEAW